MRGRGSRGVTDGNSRACLTRPSGRSFKASFGLVFPTLDTWSVTSSCLTILFSILVAFLVISPCETSMASSNCWSNSLTFMARFLYQLAPMIAASLIGTKWVTTLRGTALEAAIEWRALALQPFQSSTLNRVRLIRIGPCGHQSGEQPRGVRRPLRLTAIMMRSGDKPACEQVYLYTEHVYSVGCSVADCFRLRLINSISLGAGSSRISEVLQPMPLPAAYSVACSRISAAIDGSRPTTSAGEPSRPTNSMLGGWSGISKHRDRRS